MTAAEVFNGHVKAAVFCLQITQIAQDAVVFALLIQRTTMSLCAGLRACSEPVRDRLLKNLTIYTNSYICCFEWENAGCMCR